MLGLRPCRLCSLMASQTAATFIKFGLAPTTEIILKAIAHLAFRFSFAPGTRQHFGYRTPRKIFQKARKLGFCRSQLLIVPKLGSPSRGDPRLIRIDFPGMEIDQRRLLLFVVDSTNRPGR